MKRKYQYNVVIDCTGESMGTFNNIDDAIRESESSPLFSTVEVRWKDEPDWTEEVSPKKMALCRVTDHDSRTWTNYEVIKDVDSAGRFISNTLHHIDWKYAEFVQWVDVELLRNE